MPDLQAPLTAGALPGSLSAELLHTVRSCLANGVPRAATARRGRLSVPVIMNSSVVASDVQSVLRAEAHKGQPRGLCALLNVNLRTTAHPCSMDRLSERLATAMQSNIARASKLSTSSTVKTLCVLKELCSNTAGHARRVVQHALVAQWKFQPSAQEFLAWQLHEHVKRDRTLR